MNCCNDYGKCKQGPGCPAHTTAYNQHFNHLGNPINPVYRRSLSARLHRIAQVLGAVACVVLLVMLYHPR